MYPYDSQLRCRPRQHLSLYPSQAILSLSASADELYHAAFFTPGIFPASAFTRKLYCEGHQVSQNPLPQLLSSPHPAHSTPSGTYPRHLEIPQYTSPLPSLYAPIPNLRRPCVAMHLRQLELCLGACPCRQREVADDVSESLSIVSLHQQCIPDLK